MYKRQEHGAPAPVGIMGLPNRFITHGTVAQLLEECELMPEQIARRIEQAFAHQEREHGG